MPSLHIFILASFLSPGTLQPCLLRTTKTKEPAHWWYNVVHMVHLLLLYPEPHRQQSNNSRFITINTSLLSSCAVTNTEYWRQNFTLRKCRPFIRILSLSWNCSVLRKCWESRWQLVKGPLVWRDGMRHNHLRKVNSWKYENS